MAHPGGRPSIYTDEIALEVLSALAEGRGIVTICKAPHLPHHSTIFEWIHKRPEFAERYARAKEEAADYLADQIVEIADEAPPTLESGATDNGAVQHQRLRVEARKWTAAKLKPKKYGDKIQAEHSGADGGPIKYTVVTGVPDPLAGDRA